MFDCQAFLEQVYIKAFLPLDESGENDYIEDGKPSIQVDNNGDINPVSGNIFGQTVAKSNFPLITWVQAGSDYGDSVDTVDRSSVEFDVSISVKRPHVFPTKMEPEPPLSRLLNAAETALIEMVRENNISIASAETDENTINEIRYARAFTLTVETPVAYDGVLTLAEVADGGEYAKLFPSKQ